MELAVAARRCCEGGVAANAPVLALILSSARQVTRGSVATQLYLPSMICLSFVRSTRVFAFFGESQARLRSFSSRQCVRSASTSRGWAYRGA